jgi:hypothetical protein
MIIISPTNVRNANCIGEMVLRGKKKSKKGQPSLNRYQGPKVDLIKSLRADIEQNRVNGSNLDFCKT